MADYNVSVLTSSSIQATRVLIGYKFGYILSISWAVIEKLIRIKIGKL